MKPSLTFTSFIRNISKTYNDFSLVGKLLFWFAVFLLVIFLMRPWKREGKEGFQQSESYILKNGSDIYDGFYVDIYDDLVFNSIKNVYEVGEIINQTSPTHESRILDVGSGTGHHVAELKSRGYNVEGIDVSPDMVRKAKENYPDSQFQTGDIMTVNFENGSFTHILCMYFTLYYIKDKRQFFKRCFDWLSPGGYLVVHVVNREMFDPILPPGNPLLIVSPQRYAKERITQTQIVFDDMQYSSHFDLDTEKQLAIFREKFKHKESDRVRENEHILYMETDEAIASMGQDVGFILDAKIDLIRAHYEYQYLFVFFKPT